MHCRLLITGGSGFIGRNLVEYLRRRRHQVWAPTSAELDLLDTEAVESYLRARRYDVVIHAATVRSSRLAPASLELLERNCRMFFNVSRNLSCFGKMIHFGSGAQYERKNLPPRVGEDYFDRHVPADAYGFSKYICGKQMGGGRRIFELRLFGVFGKYEDWRVRFISNACCRVLKGMPIVMRQNVLFDYLYVDDLAKITEWFITHHPPRRAYNVCTGKAVPLYELAGMVAEVSGVKPEIIVRRPGMAPEYSGNNSRLLEALGAYRFQRTRNAIAELYRWYSERTDTFDEESLRFDEGK